MTLVEPTPEELREREAVQLWRLMGGYALCRDLSGATAASTTGLRAMPTRAPRPVFCYN